MRWRCSECGRERVPTEALRRKRGLPALKRNARTCSPECSQARLVRIRETRLEAFARILGPETPEWACCICGCSVEEALAKRKKLGLKLFQVNMRTCTPRCHSALDARLAAAMA